MLHAGNVIIKYLIYTVLKMNCDLIMMALFISNVYYPGDLKFGKSIILLFSDCPLLILIIILSLPNCFLKCQRLTSVDWPNKLVNGFFLCLKRIF